MRRRGFSVCVESAANADISGTPPDTRFASCRVKMVTSPVILRLNNGAALRPALAVAGFARSWPRDFNGKDGA